MARSGEMLRLRERYGDFDPDLDREGEREPVGEGDLAPGLRLPSLLGRLPRLPLRVLLLRSGL